MHIDVTPKRCNYRAIFRGGRNADKCFDFIVFGRISARRQAMDWEFYCRTMCNFFPKRGRTWAVFFTAPPSKKPVLRIGAAPALWRRLRALEGPDCRAAVFPSQHGKCDAIAKKANWKNAAIYGRRNPAAAYKPGVETDGRKIICRRLRRCFFRCLRSWWNPVRSIRRISAAARGTGAGN